ncbi:hypothetical protein [Streptomyces sp. SYSU K21746]
MGVSGPILVTQINRLARQLGGPLLERAERGRPCNSRHSASGSSGPQLVGYPSHDIDSFRQEGRRCCQGYPLTIQRRGLQSMTGEGAG